MRGTNDVVAVFIMQRGYLFLWVPVCFALGIGVYFSLRFEPSMALLLGAGLAGGCGLVFCRRQGDVTGPLCCGLCLILTGFSLAGLRAHQAEAPVLGWRYYGSIQGRVIGIDRSASDALRLTLDQVKLERISPQRTPERIRISLSGTAHDPDAITAGARIETTGHLIPPSGPVSPQGFDFQRHAWFVKLGALGYTRKPVKVISKAGGGWRLWIFRARMHVSKRIQTALPGDTGGFATAIITGERSAISRQALEDLRTSNTAHLLAISGLHMGLVSGLIFSVTRLILLFFPRFGHQSDSRRSAAVAALIVATLYLMISGGNVSTQRAYIMVAVMFGAVIFNRRAISMRTIAVAALIVLFWRPDSLLGPGFQMSFAATIALVAVFGWINSRYEPVRFSWLKPVFLLILSSAVAGLATAPISAAYFNSVAYYGLLANILSVPLMGVFIVPCAILAVALMPLGAEYIALWLMGAGLRWILGVADRVAGLEGARGFVSAPPASVLPLIALACLWLLLWRGRLRFAALPLMIIAFLQWNTAERPTVLIASDAALVGIMTQQGRALSKEKGAGFVARNWLRDDGDSATQHEAAKRWPEGGKRIKTMQLPGQNTLQLVHVIGKKALASIKSCKETQILVVSVVVKRDLGPCLVLDPRSLRSHGSIAFYSKNGHLKIVSAREHNGERLWSNWPRLKSSDQYERIKPTSLP